VAVPALKTIWCRKAGPDVLRGVFSDAPILEHKPFRLSMQKVKLGDMIMKIKNIKGTSGENCACDSWLKHWEKFSGQTTTWCQANGCAKTDVVGAHVQRVDIYDSKEYIYPLCNSCNQKEGSFEVSDFYKLVSADKAETCEKDKAVRSLFAGLYR
jgi:hypothetical protein